MKETGMDINVQIDVEIADMYLKFAVIAAKYNGQWIFCRHKERNTYEVPGGHREMGETIEETAKRELREETGARRFDIQPICAYSVTINQQTTYGKLFYADVFELGALSADVEISEMILTDLLPKVLTYPEIQPVLFEKVQSWLNLQSAKDEIWDVYDENRNLTSRTHRRGDPLPKGDFHLVVHVWLQNSKGEFLITKRSPNKGFPNMWECTGGSAVIGDDSLTAALREVKEETGLTAKPENSQCVIQMRRGTDFCDVWLFRQDFIVSDVVLQQGETSDAKYASKQEVLDMIENGEFIAYDYIFELFSRI